MTEEKVMVVGDGAKMEEDLIKRFDKIGERNIQQGQHIVDEPVAAKARGPIYLRLLSIATGDIELRPGRPTKCILFELQDTDGNRFMCPTVVPEPNFQASVEKYLAKIQPVIFSKEALTQAKEEVKKTSISES